LKKRVKILEEPGQKGGHTPPEGRPPIGVRLKNPEKECNGWGKHPERKKKTNLTAMLHGCPKR